MQYISYAALLDYILNRFLVVFVIVFFGSLVKDIYDTFINLSPISIKRILISSLFGTVVLCAVVESFKLSISAFVLVCFLSGVWSFKILEYMMNWKFVKVLVKNIFKSTKTVIGDAVSETLEDLNDEESSEEKSKALNDKNNTKDESVPK